MKPSDLRRCLHVSNCESKVNPKLCLYVLSVLLVLRGTVYLNVLPDCVCSDASESSSWNSPSAVDTEIAWLSDATSCTSPLNSNITEIKQADLSNTASDLGCWPGLTSFCRGGRGRIQVEKSGQCALVSQSESPRCGLAHHMCTKVNEVAVNFQLVGENLKKKN